MNALAAIDAHVHIIGNGHSGSGCKVSLKGLNRILSKFMLREMGLPSDALERDLDTLFVENLLRLVRSSRSIAKVIILAHEHTYDDSGTCLPDFSSLYVPNNYVLKLSREHPEFLAAVSIHPAREDAIEELHRCKEEGAVMLKCLPNCQNIDCSKDEYAKFWEAMAQLGLPLLAHTGGELSLPVYSKALENPEILKGPLECGVTVIAAHAATSSGFFDTDYFDCLLAMVKKYPRLYVDTSALNTPFRAKRIKDCLLSPMRERLIHGSDLPIPNWPVWAFLRGLISLNDFKRCRAEKNYLERDFLTKRLSGFPDECFTRISALLPS